MGVVLKVLAAVFALLGAAACALIALVVLIYAFSSEMPRDQVVPSAAAGFGLCGLALALAILAIWIMVSIFKNQKTSRVDS
jgi:protein-S-isoprenylcysteine O-methyltransferase Ste14